MTQQELADAVQLDRSMIGKMEAERVFISPEVFRRLTATLRSLNPLAFVNAIGYTVTAPGEARLPRALLERLLAMSPEQHQALLAILPDPRGRRP